MSTLLTYMGHGKIIFTGMKWKTMNILNCWNCLWSIRERYCYLAMTMTSASMTALPRLARYTLSPGLSAIPRW